MKEQLDRIEYLASLLNKSSETIQKTFSEINERFREMNLGLPTTVIVNDELILCYGRYKSKESLFRLYVVKKGEEILVECINRQEKILVYKALGTLIENMIEELEETLTKLNIEFEE